MTLPASAKDTAKAITRWCETEGVAHTFTHLKGGHLAVVMRRQGKTRRVVFSASPSDRRSVENVLRDVRKEARVLGWTPKSQEDKMGICIGGSYAHKPKTEASIGPAGPVTITRPSPDKAPAPPARFAFKRFGPGNMDKQLRAALAKRNDWAIKQEDAGRPHEDILKDLTEVGWVLTNVASIHSMIERTRNKAAGYVAPSRQKKADKQRQELAWTIQQVAPSDTPYMALDPAQRLAEIQKDMKKQQREKLEAKQRKDGVATLSAEQFDDLRQAMADKRGLGELAQAIERAIIPVMEAHFAKQHAELKAKADKWDAISGLVREA